MSEILLFDHELAARLAAVLVHSLWQAPLLGLVMWGLLRSIPAKQARLRYAISLAALLAVVMAAAATWTLLGDRPAPSVAGDLPARLSAASDAGPLASTPSGAVESSGSVPATWKSSLAENWQAIVVACWLLGVLLMFVRLSRSLHETIALARNTDELPDDVVRLLETLRRQLGISQRLAVVASSRVLVPGVVGVVWPTLVLPVSMVTGMTPDELRAILVHELIHIRRHDFAVNLVQMVIESLLFFNPAVWWISRRVRLEREACVDAATVNITGNGLEYASLLAGVAERLTSAAPAIVALSEPVRHGTLLERVKRIVEPGVPPTVRLPWLSLLLLVTLAAMAVAGIWQGTSTAVQLAQKLMTDQQRVDAVQTACKELGPGADSDEPGQGTLRGTIRTADGRPLVEKVWLYGCSKSPNYSLLSSLGDFDGEFSVSIRSGTVWLAASADGYAPVYVGPYRLAPDQTIDGVEIVLPVGFPASVRVVDSQGQPVEGAKVNVGLTTDGFSVGRNQDMEPTDADGITRLAHAAGGLYRVTVKQPGFQPYEKKLRLSAEKAVEIQLEPVKPFRGRVVFNDGQPVAGAKIRLLHEQMPSGGINHGDAGPLVAETDADGHFMLDELHDNRQYALLVEGPQSQLAVMDDVSAGGKGTLTMAPPLTFEGRITGPLDKLDSDRRGPYVQVFQRAKFDLGHEKSTGLGQKVYVEVDDDAGTFTCHRLLPGTIAVVAAGHPVETSITAEEPTVRVDIDLNQPPSEQVPASRSVVFRFVCEGQAVSPEGSISVSAFPRAGLVPAQPILKRLPVTEGQAAIDVPTPGSASCEPKGMIGWSFAPVYQQVDPGDGPLEIDVPVVPAGAIQGHISFAGTPPAPGKAKVSVYSIHEKKEPNGSRLISNTVDAVLNENDRFLATPIPLGARCSVNLTVGHNVVACEPFTLEATEPICEADLRLPKPAKTVVKVVDPDGRPVDDLPLTLSWSQKGASGYSWTGDGMVTDSQGRLTFTDLNTAGPHYAIVVDSHKTWLPVRVPLDVASGETTVRLTRGKTLSVTLVNAATGEPVSGVEVYAICRGLVTVPGAASIFEAESPTDSEGKCRFSTLPALPVTLGLRAMLEVTPPVSEVNAAKTEAVTLRTTAR